MKILIVVNHKRDPESGAAGGMERLGRAIEGIGHHVDFIFGDNIRPFLFSINPNLSAIVDVPLFIIKRVMDLELTGSHYDIVQISSAEGYLYGFFKKLFHKRSIYVYQSPGLENRYWQDYFKIEDVLGGERMSKKFKIWFPYIRLNQERLAINMADAILVPCKQDKEFLVNNLCVKPSKVFTIPYGVLREFFVNNNKKGRDKDLIFVGWWGQRKGRKYLSEAFTQVCRRYPEAQLTIIGSKVVDSEVYASFLPSIRKNIKVYRSMSHSNLSREYKRHKIMTFPSLFEGLPQVVLEGMAAGLAVVASPVARDIIKDGKNGFLVPFRSSNSLAEKVIYLLDNEEIREKIGHRATKATRDYTWDTIARRTVKVFQNLLTKGLS